MAVGVLVVALVALGGAAAIVANQGNPAPVAPTVVPTKQSPSGTSGVATPTATKPAPPVPTVPPGVHVEHIKGSATAKVTIVEYSDFQCPYCALYAVQTFPQIDAKYVKTGQVKYVFRPLALSGHRQAQKAAEAAECAMDQGKYWEMHDMLFARQQQWAEKGGAVEIFKGYAKSLGLDESAFATCLDGSKYAAVMPENYAEAQRAGISGTPTFFVNGRMLPGAYPFEEFAKVIDEELAK